MPIFGFWGGRFLEFSILGISGPSGRRGCVHGFVVLAKAGSTSNFGHGEAFWGGGGGGVEKTRAKKKQES